MKTNIAVLDLKRHWCIMAKLVGKDTRDVIPHPSRPEQKPKYTVVATC